MPFDSVSSRSHRLPGLLALGLLLAASATPAGDEVPFRPRPLEIDARRQADERACVAVLRGLPTDDHPEHTFGRLTRLHSRWRGSGGGHAFSPRANVLAVGDSEAIVLWDLNTGREVW